VFRYPSLKEPDYSDYPEYDGIDVDLTAPKLDTKNVSIQFASVTTENDEIDNFFIFILQDGYREFKINSLGRSWKLRLSKENSRTVYKNLQDLTIVFIDDFPLRSTGSASGHGFNLPRSQYQLDGKRFDEYGIIVNKGKASVYSIPDVKPKLVVKSNYSDGAKSDTENVTFSHKDVVLECSFLTDSIERFWNNYDAFLSDLVKPELRILGVTYANDFFDCYYKNSNNFSFTMHPSYILCQFTLTLVFTDFRPKRTVTVLATEDYNPISPDGYPDTMIPIGADYKSDTSVIDTFVRQIIQKGGDGQAARAMYNSLDAYIRYNARIILFPTIVENGIIYGMDNTTGYLVRFTFSRSSQATLFDKDMNMQLVDAGMPRIDFGNYSQAEKILIERESTNFISNSVDFSALSSTSIKVEATEYYCKGFNKYFRLEKLTSTTSTQIIFSFSNPTANAEFTIYGYLKKGNTNKINIGLYDTKWDASRTTVEVLEGNANSGLESNGAPYFELISDEIKFKVTRSGMTSGTMTARFYPDGWQSSTIGKNILLSSIQVESGNQATSHIPTTTAQVTRSADLLYYNLANACSVYLKTTKQNIVLDKPAERWNIHEDLSNEGIITLDVFDRILTDEEKQQLTA